MLRGVIAENFYILTAIDQKMMISECIKISRLPTIGRIINTSDVDFDSRVRYKKSDVFFVWCRYRL